eukprot:TRINITY_DN21898_c0_g1_i1.p1 TRINITY_DN21898_c0_g1~~TRINITY_DN21898_c0_g1_i1.p1  ORF type:complete len:697 (-),score=163.24 TRINITY_DN21898_c0_g1_i1:122-2113(-)
MDAPLPPLESLLSLSRNNSSDQLPFPTILGSSNCNNNNNYDASSAAMTSAAAGRISFDASSSVYVVHPDVQQFVTPPPTGAAAASSSSDVADFKTNGLRVSWDEKGNAYFGEVIAPSPSPSSRLLPPGGGEFDNESVLGGRSQLRVSWEKLVQYGEIPSSNLGPSQPMLITPLQLAPDLVSSSGMAPPAPAASAPARTKDRLAERTRKVCQTCSKDHKVCSGPPGPCERCTKRGKSNECHFEKSKIPGPKPKAASSSHHQAPPPAQSINASTAITFSYNPIMQPAINFQAPLTSSPGFMFPPPAASEQKDVVMTGNPDVTAQRLVDMNNHLSVSHNNVKRNGKTKRSRRNNADDMESGVDYLQVSPNSSDSRSISPSVQSSKMSDSQQKANEVQEVIKQLQTNHFMENETDTQSSFRNETYYTICIANAVNFWNNSFDPDASYITKEDFIRGMIAYQDSSPEFNYGLDETDLQKLFWLTGLERDDEDDFLPPLLLKHHVGLIFLWLGPATARNVTPAYTAVREIYEYVNSSPVIRSNFEGFYSRHAACFKLRSNPRPTASDAVFRLNEGRLTLVAQQEFGFMRSATREKSEYYMRNLVRTRYPQSILYQAQTGQPIEWVSDDEFVHELLLAPQIPNNSQSSSEGTGPEQRLASTRNRRYIWMH